jgi:predicted amidohydrolase
MYAHNSRITNTQITTMKIALAQLNYHIGNFEGNLTKMLKAIEKAKAEKADLICFGELATCGYPPRDFLEFDDFIRRCYESIEELVRVSHGYITLLICFTEAKYSMFSIRHYCPPTIFLMSTDILSLPQSFRL